MICILILLMSLAPSFGNEILENQNEHANKQIRPDKEIDLLYSDLQATQHIDAFTGEERRSGRIVGGEDADIADYPWQVALLENDDQYCAGSIIHEQWILTAAHCLTFDRPDKVRAGVTNKNDTTGQDVYVDYTIVHPDLHNPVDDAYDIALIKLEIPLDLSCENVSKISILTQSDADAGLTNPGTMTTILGWGALFEGGPSSNVLQVAEAPIVSNEDAMTIGGYEEGTISDDMICAGFLGEGGIDACQGDSGGPLMVPDLSGGYRLAGVTSWGIGCARPDYPGVYIRVNYAENWIKEHVDLVPPDAPSAPEAFVAEADAAGALEATLSWTNPSATYDGQQLTNINELHLYRNGDLIQLFESPAAGDQMNFVDDDLSDHGLYFYEIFAINDAGEGYPSSALPYVGFDVPARPDTVAVTPAGKNAVISWSPAMNGLNQGYFEDINISYTIHRYPCDVELEAGITDTVFFDADLPAPGNYSYAVTAENHIGEGGRTFSVQKSLRLEGLLLNETFDLSYAELPDEWSVEGDGQDNWGAFNANTAGGEAPEIRFNHFPGFQGISKLVTHNIQLENYNELVLYYKHFLNNHGSLAGEISVHFSTDHANNWTEIFSYDGVEDYGPEAEKITFEIDEESENIQFGFRWEGMSFDIWHWNLDDVFLETKGAYFEALFTVTDVDHEPISGATVMLENSEAIPAMPGDYFFGMLREGSYDYNIKKPGFGTAQGTIQIADENLDKHIVLERTGFQVIFDPVTEDGEPITDAVITLNEEQNPTGEYVFEEVPPGIYKYTVEKDYYYPVTDSLEVLDQDLVKTVVMQPDETAIESGNHDPDLTIYPNPAQNNLTVTSENYSIKQVVIKDLNGITVKEAAANTTHLQLNISALKPGVYIFSVSAGDTLVTRKIHIYR